MDAQFQNLDLPKIKELIKSLKHPKSLAQAQKNPSEFFAEHGIILPADAHYSIHLNDNQYYYFVVPAPMNAQLNDQEIQKISAAAKTASTATSILSLSTASSNSCPSVTIWTAGTISSVSSVGSLNPSFENSPTREQHHLDEPNLLESQKKV